MAKTTKKKLTKNVNEDVKNYVNAQNSLLSDLIKDMTESDNRLKFEADGEEDEFDDMEEAEETPDEEMDDMFEVEGDEPMPDDEELEEADDDKEIEDILNQLEEADGEEDEEDIDLTVSEEGEEDKEIDFDEADKKPEDEDPIEEAEAEGDEEEEEKVVEANGEACDYKAKYESQRKRMRNFIKENKKLKRELLLKTKTLRESTLSLYSAKTFMNIKNKTNLTKEQQERLAKNLSECKSTKEMDRVKEAFTIAVDKKNKFNRAKRIARTINSKKRLGEDVKAKKSNINESKVYDRLGQLID